MFLYTLMGKSLRGILADWGIWPEPIRTTEDVVRGASGLARTSDEASMMQLLQAELGPTRNYSTNELEGISAVFACVRVLSYDLGCIPLALQYNEDDRRHAKELAAYDIIANRPSVFGSKSLFWQAFWWNAILGGKGFAQIIRNGRYEPVRLRLWRWNQVSVIVNDSTIEPTVMFQTPFELLPYEDMIYLPMNSLDGIEGRTTLQINRESAGEALAAQKHGNAFYQNGAKQQGVLKVPTRLSNAPGNNGQTEEAKAANARQRLRENFSSIGSSGQTPILEEGIDFVPLNMSMGDAEFVETRRFSAEQICGIYGVPPALVQSYRDSRYANSEQMDLSYVKHTLTPYMTLLEEELLRKLVPSRLQGQLEVVGDMDYLLRGDIETQTNYYSTLLGKGVLTRNDVLREKKRPTFKGGDERWMEAGMMPEETARQYYGKADNTGT